MKILLLLGLTVSLVSCRSSEPKGILQPGKMKAVLWDIMQADELGDHQAMKDTAFNSLSHYSELYQKVFAVHGTSKEEFKRSLAYYESHPAKLKIIIDSLQKFGERLRAADTLKKPAAPAVADTLPKKVEVPEKQD